jgi:hypothetical protein
VKWQTRAFEGRMPQGVGVQVPPRALSVECGARLALKRDGSDGDRSRPMCLRMIRCENDRRLSGVVLQSLGVRGCFRGCARFCDHALSVRIRSARSPCVTTLLLPLGRWVCERSSPLVLHSRNRGNRRVQKRGQWAARQMSPRSCAGETKCSRQKSSTIPIFSEAIRRGWVNRAPVARGLWWWQWWQR